MGHLTEEQFEELMQDENVRFSHLTDCIECRGRLSEKQGLACRLRSAFTTIKPTDGLAERTREKLNINSKRMKDACGRRSLGGFFQRRGWLSLASAAAVLIIVIPLVFFTAEPSSASAAKAELVRIHREHLSSGHKFYNQDDPQKVANYFKRELGISLIIPRAKQGYTLRGCCLCRLKGKTAGSYVVETPQGVLSIIVVTDNPQSLGISRKIRRGKHIFWIDSFAGCKLAVVRIGQHSYCAVGEVPETQLREVLVRLVPQSAP